MYHAKMEQSCIKSNQIKIMYNDIDYSIIHLDNK